MDREIIRCEDGSFSVRSERFGQTYHSETGALAESEHVYLHSGLDFRLDAGREEGQPLKVFEAGLGTGLDVLLTALRAEKQRVPIDYRVVELYPLQEEEWSRLDYAALLTQDYPETAVEEIFRRIHSCPWDTPVPVTEHFTLTKIAGDISDLKIYGRPAMRGLDVVYFDAFSPDCQPELWSREIFSALFAQMNEGGVLTTYSSKGMVKENLREAGFFVRRLKGIGHKRHIVRAVK